MVVEMRLHNHVGIGSSGQDLAGHVDSSLVISETVVGLNSVSSGTSRGTITGRCSCFSSEYTDVGDLVDEGVGGCV